ncbi:MAG TPA: hypothetical protein VH853_18985 [Polyangia bacterium]|nr:hypothetical protein [Polyangia bacterium]
MRSARVNSLLCALLLVVTRVAGAEEELAVTTARLEVQAPPDCTTREELAARVAARSRRIHFDDEASGPSVRAAIARAPRGGAVGELVIVEPGGRSSSRRLSAPTCAEATDAIALIIALTLDPASKPAPATATPVPPAAAATPPRTAPVTTGAAPERARVEPSDGRTPTPAATPSAATPSAASKPTIRTETAPQPATSAGRRAVVIGETPEPPVATQVRFGAGAAAQAIFGPAPGTLPGVAVYLLAALDRDAVWSPAVIVWATHALSSGLVEPGGRAAFTLDALILDACALRLRVSVFEGRACATGMYGRLAASGSETYSPATAARPYAVAGGALLFSAALGRLDLTGRVGGGASLVRDSFAFAPTVFHRTDAVTVAASLGLGVRFP